MSDKNKKDWTVAFLPDPEYLEKKPLPGGMSATIYILALMVLTAIAWAAVFEVDKIVTARGRLISTQPNIVLQALETSQVKRINVIAGQIVSKGQTLAVLDPTFIMADLNQTKDRLANVASLIDRLESELNLPRSNRSTIRNQDNLQNQLQNDRLSTLKAKLNRFGETEERIKASINTNAQNIKIIQARVKSLENIENMNARLVEQNYQSNLRLLESRERRQEVERELINALNQKNELEKQIDELNAEKQLFTKEWRQRLTEELIAAKQDKDQITELLKKAEKRSSLISINSPVDAVVLNIIGKTEGSVVREAETIFTLVPLNDEVDVEIRISASDIGYIKLQDPVRIKIDAFPFQKHGLLKGELSNISQDSQTNIPGFDNDNAPYYMARAVIKHNELRNLPRNAPLLPGMTASTELVVGKRTVLSYVMYPVIRGLNEAITEP